MMMICLSENECKPNYRSFMDAIKNRGIKYLVHFTPTVNLYSIYNMKKILCRKELEELDIDHYDIFDLLNFTDDIRFDDKNYINLSISSPNTLLLNRFRQRKQNDCTILWCVILISPEFIFHKDTMFSVTNAASNAAKREFGITGDITKFNQLFEEELTFNTYSGKKCLTRGTLGRQYPTDIQAEVLVKCPISLDGIIKICFSDNVELAQTRAAFYDFDTEKFVVDRDVFSNNRGM